MNGYASNPASGAESKAASLTSSLLARKGQAMPAVDAEAHEGVEIDLLNAGGRPRPRIVSENDMEGLYASNPGNAAFGASEAITVDEDDIEDVDRDNVRPFTPRPSFAEPAHANDAAPAAWTILPPPAGQSAASGRQLKRRRIEAAKARARAKLAAGDLAPASAEDAETPRRAGGLRATVTFRMPATDFVRMRFASRDLNVSCQSIILDAIGAYLDANEIDEIDEEEAKREAARLVRAGRSRKAQG